METYKATFKQIKNNEISLEEVREAFLEMGVRNKKFFSFFKKIGDLEVPSFDNLNALCLERTCEKFEKFFFGNSELNKRIENKLLDTELVLQIKEWCKISNVTTLMEYRITKRPDNFPTYKATVNNYGEEYFYEILWSVRCCT